MMASCCRHSQKNLTKKPTIRSVDVVLSRPPFNDKQPLSRLQSRIHQRRIIDKGQRHNAAATERNETSCVNKLSLIQQSAYTELFQDIYTDDRNDIPQKQYDYREQPEIPQQCVHHLTNPQANLHAHHLHQHPCICTLPSSFNC
jgi:hypothetical protein